MDPALDDCFEVPWDRTKTSRVFRWDGKPRAIKGAVLVPAADLTNQRNRDLPRYGFPIHDHCWTLIERVMGSGIERQLHLLVPALLKRWDYWNEPPQKQRCPFQVSTLNAWTSQMCFSLKRAGPFPFFPLLDPVHCAPIKRLIKKSIRRRANMRATIQGSSCGLLSKSLNRGVLLDLPFDIQCLILDHIDLSQLKDVLDGLGWQVDDQYWRVRSRNIIFEAEGIGSDVDMDWQFLFVESMTLMESHPLLRNRRRILDILNGTNRVFMRLVQAEARQKIRENNRGRSAKKPRRTFARRSYALRPRV